MTAVCTKCSGFWRVFLLMVLTGVLLSACGGVSRPKDPQLARKYDAIMEKKKEYGREGAKAYKNADVYEGDVQVTTSAYYTLVDTKNWNETRLTIFQDGEYSEENIRNLFEMLVRHAKRYGDDNLFDSTPKLADILTKETLRVYQVHKDRLNSGEYNAMIFDINGGYILLYADIMKGEDIVSLQCFDQLAMLKKRIVGLFVRRNNTSSENFLDLYVFSADGKHYKKHFHGNEVALHGYRY